MASKWVSVVVLAVLALSGPLAPLSWAQQKVEGQMAPMEESDVAWKLAAGVTNAVHVPGKAVLCLTGGAVGVVFLIVSFGSGYTWAGRAWEEGCGGRWTVTADDLKPGDDEEPEFWMERPEFRR